jgi:serine/threonine protein kinase
MVLKRENCYLWPPNSPKPWPPEPGSAQYEVKRLLGAGGFAHTYLTLDHHLNRLVALKELFVPEFFVRNGDGVSVSARSLQRRRTSSGKDEPSRC